MFEPKDILTLDDGKDYIVVREIKLDNKMYVCLAEVGDTKKISFTSYTKNGDDVLFDDVEDSDTIIKLMKIIRDQAAEGTL